MLVAVCVIAVGATIWYWISYLRGPSGHALHARAVPAARERQRGGAALARARRQGASSSPRSSPEGSEGRRLAAGCCAASSPTPATRGSRASTARRRRAARSRRRRAALDRSVRFAVLADYGSGDDNEWAVGRAAGRPAPEFAVTAGDNSYLVAAEVLLDRNIFRPLADLMGSAPMYVCLGDHDNFFPGPGADQQRLRPARGRPLHGAPRADPGRRSSATSRTSPPPSRSPGRRSRTRAGRALRRLPPPAADRRSDPARCSRESGARSSPATCTATSAAPSSGVQTFTVGTGGKGPGSLDTRRPRRAPT